MLPHLSQVPQQPEVPCQLPHHQRTRQLHDHLLKYCYDLSSQPDAHPNGDDNHLLRRTSAEIIQISIQNKIKTYKRKLNNLTTYTAGKRFHIWILHGMPAQFGLVQKTLFKIFK